MATTKPAERATGAADAALDAMFEPDGSKFGRHHSRFAEYGTHVHAVLNELRRTGQGIVTQGDVAEAARGWHMTADAVRAAIRYYERHRDIFDAYFLLQDEEWRAWNDA